MVYVIATSRPVLGITQEFRSRREVRDWVEESDCNRLPEHPESTTVPYDDEDYQEANLKLFNMIKTQLRTPGLRRNSI